MSVGTVTVETAGESDELSGGGEPAELTSAEVRGRAARGAAMFAGREMAIQAISFVTALVLARLLTPADFGITTLGLTIVSAANTCADAGVGASLIARKAPPTQQELGAILGLQLTVATACLAIAAPLGLYLGGDGPATAIIMLALPAYALRTPPLLVLERRLEFAPRILVQLAELLIYGGIAIPLAVLGLGVWAMPIALVARSAGGTIIAYRITGTKAICPSMQLRLLKPILGFGVRFQMRSLTQLARDLIVVSLVGSLGGFRDLGYYGFCYRLLTVPQLVQTALGEVTFPAFSRLAQNNEDVNGLLERSTAAITITSALLIAPFVAASPALIPLLFGARWAGASLLLPGAGLSLIIGAPLGVSVLGYLYAAGDARTPLWGNVVNGAFIVLGIAVLTHAAGLVGIGIAMSVGVIVATPFMVAGVTRRGGPDLLRPIFAPAAIAALGMAVGWGVCRHLHNGVVGAVAALGATVAVQLVLLVLSERSALNTSMASARRMLSLVSPRLQAVLRG